MIDVFFEETVRPSDSVRAGRNFKIMQFISRSFLVSAILFTFFLFYTPVQIILPVAFMTALSYFLYFFTKSKKNKYLVDYDYTFVSGELRIAKVLNNSKRKPMAKIDCSSISALGKITSDNYPRYKTMPGIKTIIATPNAESNTENIYFALCVYKSDKSLLIFEPSANLVYNIKRFAGTNVNYV